MLRPFLYASIHAEQYSNVENVKMADGLFVSKARTAKCASNRRLREKGAQMNGGTFFVECVKLKESSAWREWYVMQRAIRNFF